MARTHKGFFKPKNPSKYKGDPTGIVWRSRWELKFFMEIDADPNVLEWSSEEKVVPYISPMDNCIHRYYPDVILKRRRNNKTETVMIEIKPESQSGPPKKPIKMTNAYKKQVMTWGINESKWAAARKYCEKNGWLFEVMGETALKIPKRGK